MSVIIGFFGILTLCVAGVGYLAGEFPQGTATLLGFIGVVLLLVAIIADSGGKGPGGRSGDRATGKRSDGEW